jgi:hypothetical protein
MNSVIVSFIDAPTDSLRTISGYGFDRLANLAMKPVADHSAEPRKVAAPPLAWIAGIALAGRAL